MTKALTNAERRKKLRSVTYNLIKGQDKQPR